MGRYFYEALLVPRGRRWETSVPELGLVTEGDSMEEAAYRAQDAIALNVSGRLADGEDVPEVGSFGHTCPEGGMTLGILTVAEPGRIFDETMSVQEAADVLGVSRSRIHALLAAGALGSVKVGNARMVSASDVMRRFNTPHAPGRPRGGAAQA
ncbi:type II toxin-antitoxin system HicB family antitoxin [Olsenella profusa]|nr:excisionase family DNA-binding protein [Olsenella profusa]